MNRHRAARRLLLFVVAASLAAPTGALGRDPLPPAAGSAEFARRPLQRANAPAPDTLLVRYRPGTSARERSAVRSAQGLAKIRSVGADLEVVRPRGGGLAAAAASVRRSPHVLAVEPNGYAALFVDPTGEPLWAEQWGHHNTGQVIPGADGFDYEGVSDVDVDGLESLAQSTGSGEVVVAVIDDGVDFGHPDLDGRAWVNSGETGLDGLGNPKETNDVDDDGNGYVDDVNGWDFCNDDNTVHDFGLDWHGTGVAGVIAAERDGAGTVGIAPATKIMALKFLQDALNVDGEPCGAYDMAIAAIQYAKANGADLINASWGGSGTSTALKTAIQDSGLLFVAAAGNGGNDGVGDSIDVAPTYPAAFDSPNIVSVAAIHNEGGLTSFSNYGIANVDLGAPGEGVLGPCPEDGEQLTEPWWCWLDGTSFSAPYVAGIAALVGAAQPALLATPTALKAHLINTAVPLGALTCTTASGRLVNADRALDSAFATATAGISVLPIVGSTLGTSSARVRLSWPATGNLATGPYFVRQSRNRATVTNLTTSTTARTLDVGIALSGTYQFCVNGRSAGKLTPQGLTRLISPLRYEEGTSLAAYAGTWTSSSSTSASGGRTRYTTASNASVTFTFNGRTGAVVAPTGPTRSSFKVYLDGVYVKTISLYSSTARNRVIVYTTGTLGAGTHKIKLVHTRVGSRIRADVDAFVVLR